MHSFFSLLGRRWGGAWVGALLLLALGWLRPEAAHASHVRAGDIQAQVDSITGNPNHIFFKLTVYRDKGGVALGPATVYFGDGSCQSGIPIANTVVVTSINTDVNTFFFDHTYAGSGTYTVSYIEDNRNPGVINMTSSDSQSFYISTTVSISAVYGRNHSAILKAPAIDRANVGQVFLHNPAGYDADGDSLAYKLRTCQQVNGGKQAVTNCTPVPVTCNGYVYPDDISITPVGVQIAYPLPGVPITPGVLVGIPGAPTVIKQNVYTGQITWNVPVKAGTYNIAFTVEEWRRTPYGRTLIGMVIRDMQIIVEASKNLPPSLTVPDDICVVANKPVTLTVSATDGTGTGNDAPTPITLTAYSGILPPATFTQTTTATTSTGTFRWTPDCSKVSSLPYTVVFKAQDSPTTASGSPILIDEKPVRITVLGPPPQNVKAVASSSGSQLVSIVSWDPYTCTNASGLLIFRREGCASYTPGSCDTGLPASAGYTQIASVPVTTTTYADNGAPGILERGKTYSYRVYATFALPARSNSVVSDQVCLTFNGKAARLTNVDVTNTDATQGRIAVKWTQPRNAGGTPFSAPYGYRLSRAIGNGAYTLAATITNLSDTTYVDQGLNTTDNQYKYQLVFFSTTGGAEQAETAATATSGRTTLVPNGQARTISVTWAQQVPWDNSKQPTLIFRKDNAATVFTQIASVASGLTGGTYLDQNLVRDQQYCYYVQTNGQYSDVNSLGNLLLSNLLNKSQQQCVVLTAAPCTPVLSLAPVNCDSLAALPSFPSPNQQYQNKLSWTVGNTPSGCDVAAAYYRILRGTGTGPYTAIDSTRSLSYLNRYLSQSNYCYVVQAVSAGGIRSALSNSVCQDNCVFFTLPNIFTPNGDGVNDLFKPKTASGVLATHTQVFNRWGRKVYEGNDPYINWAGGGATGENATNDMVSGGLYYYLVEVQFSDAAQTKRTFKGWVQIMR